MSLHYVIDGYNLINHSLFSQFAPKNKDQRAALVSLIMAKRLCGSLKNKISLVFDGYPAVGEITMKAANMDLLFSRSDTADESIKRIVERSSNPKNVVVVSDDKEIRFCVKPLGAKAKSIEEFMQPLNKSKSKAQDKESLKKELTYSQIDSINKELEKRWLKYF